MLAPITKAELQAAIVSATEARDIAFMEVRAAGGWRLLRHRRQRGGASCSSCGSQQGD